MLQLKQFRRSYSSDLSAISRTVEQALEKVENNVGWMETNYDNIRDWLQQQNTQLKQRSNIIALFHL